MSYHKKGISFLIKKGEKIMLKKSISIWLTLFLFLLTFGASVSAATLSEEKTATPRYTHFSAVSINLLLMPSVALPPPVLFKDVQG